jgi:hypothetical protein
MTDKTVVSSRVRLRRGPRHGREVVRALAWRCRAQARCRPRQRHLSSEGRGAAEDERAERTVIRSLSE